ncbi:MAG TPA: MarR family transcriptional regulator [Euzebya sp.]|nr:MarR family transcriptional regulator [Euzebya sp.]
MDHDRAHDPLVRDVIRMTFELTGRLRAHMDGVAASLDLTPMQARALFVSHQPVPMGLLAESLHCDASNVTGIVDRLEERGLMERVVDPDDRRRKNLVLTAAGRRGSEQLKDRLRADNPILSLDGPELEVLHGLLLQVLSADVPPEMPRRTHPSPQI